MTARKTVHGTIARRVRAAVTCILVVTIAVLWRCTRAAESVADSRRLTVVVEASLSDGQAVEKLLISLWHANEPLTDGFTDAKGICKLEADVPEDTKAIEIRHAFAGNRSTLPQNQQIELARRINSLRTKYAFQESYTITLQPDFAEYSLPITAVEGITVTGVIRDARGRPVAAMIMGPPPGMPALSKRGEPFTLKGLPRATASTLFVSADSVVVAIPLSQEQTTEDVDLGNVTLPRIEGNRSLDFTLLSGVELRESGAKYQPGLILIPVGKQWALTFKGSSAQPAEGTTLVKTPALVPDGTYAVIPGWFLRANEPAAMCEAAFAGADLRDSGVPIIEVSEGGSTKFEINVVNAWNQMDAWLKKRAIKRPNTAPASMPSLQQSP